MRVWGDIVYVPNDLSLPKGFIYRKGIVVREFAGKQYSLSFDQFEKIIDELLLKILPLAKHSFRAWFICFDKGHQYVFTRGEK